MGEVQRAGGREEPQTCFPWWGSPLYPDSQTRLLAHDCHHRPVIPVLSIPSPGPHSLLQTLGPSPFLSPLLPFAPTPEDVIYAGAENPTLKSRPPASGPSQHPRDAHWGQVLVVTVTAPDLAGDTPLPEQPSFV